MAGERGRWRRHLVVAVSLMLVLQSVATPAAATSKGIARATSPSVSEAAPGSSERTTPGPLADPGDLFQTADPSGECGIDLVADVGFSLFSLGQLIFGPEKQRGENFGYMMLDVGGIFIPCGAGLGTVARGARFIGDAAGNMRMFVGGGTLEVGFHAAQRMAQRGVHIDVVTTLSPISGRSVSANE